MYTKKFKKLFLHIGLGKTGTTTIQEDLLANAEILESKYDLHYPRGFSHAEVYEGNHSVLLRTLFSNSPEVKERLSAIGLHDQKSIDKFNKRTVKQLTRGFEKTSAHNLLLSAESIGHFRRPQLNELVSWLNELSESVIVIACLRHPMHALSSEIQQRLFIGEELETMYSSPPRYLFKQLLKRLENAFGRENIIVYSFNDAVQEGCGLTTVFLRQLGIVADLDFPRSKPANTSISHEGALLLSSVNRERPIMLNGSRNPARIGVDIDYFRDLPGRPYRAPAEVYNSIENSAATDVQWAEEEYGIDLGRPEKGAEESYRNFSLESIDFIANQLAERSREQHPLIQKTIHVLAEPSLIFYKLVSFFGVGKLSSRKRSAKC